MASMNMDDPSKQEQIRRGTHEYVTGDGKHGTYVPRQFKQQEYPKMMSTERAPELKDFLTKNGVSIPHDIASQNFQTAFVEWDRRMTASIVHSKAEEAQWLKQNAN